MNYGYSAPEDSFSWLLPEDEPYRYNLNLVRLALESVPLDRATVLECGSGRGGNCLYLDRYTGAAAICGFDICEPHVQLCDRLYCSNRLHFLCADAAHMPFPSNWADVLLNVESSHCYPGFDGFLAEVHRVLKPGGYFAYADLWDLSIFNYNWADRRRALDHCGLALLNEEDVSEGVFRALQREDSLSQTVRATATSENASLVEAILRANEAMRLTLAVRQCCYKVMLMRKAFHG